MHTTAFEAIREKMKNYFEPRGEKLIKIEEGSKDYQAK